MGRQRSKPPQKRKKEALERLLLEIEANQLSYTEFKAKVIRKLIELTENYRNYRETTMNSLQTTST